MVKFSSNGCTYTNRRGETFDNCYIVPYNPFLSTRCDCHINVEVCASVKAIKYIHKYIYKVLWICRIIVCMSILIDL
jgi:hypothetical protein